MTPPQNQICLSQIRFRSDWRNWGCASLKATDPCEECPDAGAGEQLDYFASLPRPCVLHKAKCTVHWEQLAARFGPAHILSRVAAELPKE